jgi:hypothetical protein
VLRKARLTQGEIALIDAARGTRSRGEWVRAAVVDAARRGIGAPAIERLPGERKEVNFRCADFDADTIERARGSTPRENYISIIALRAASQNNDL